MKPLLIIISFFICLNTLAKADETDIRHKNTFVRFQSDTGGALYYSNAETVENPSAYESKGISCRCQYLGPSETPNADLYLITFSKNISQNESIPIANYRVDYFGEQFEIRMKNMVCYLSPKNLSLNQNSKDKKTRRSLSLQLSDH